MTAARFSSLQDWLTWQETLHPREIDLGLERVARVARRLDVLRPADTVVSVAGTNGKGSSVALLEAVYARAGYRVGSYTSPHLFAYNERIRINGDAVVDDVICRAFERIDAARGQDSLTYFEFGTLAALLIMADAGVDIAVLEVGLGGRLDAVNIVDADVALITSIGIDHTDWLGDDREAIAREKAGIMRPGKAAICADAEPPQSLLQSAQSIGAQLLGLEKDFHIGQAGRGWHWQGPDSRLRDLPRPSLPGTHQLANAAGVLMAIEVLQERLQVERSAIEAGLRWMRLPGRVQRIPGAVEQVLDVSHNAQAAQALADALSQEPVAGRTCLVLGMMADKDVDAFIEPLLPLVDMFCTTGLQVQRAASGQQLAERIERRVPGCPLVCCASMAEVPVKLKEKIEKGDRILVCGSFHTVAEWSQLKPEFI